jgi:phosphoserine phosphatase RsbU/P
VQVGGAEVAAPTSRAALEDRLRDIQSITDAALSRLDDHQLLTELLERTRAILQADTAAVLLLDFASGHLIAAAAAGLEEEVRQGVRIPVGRGFAGRIAAEHRPVILDKVDHSTVLNPILLAKGIRALMGVPLIIGGRVIGVLHVGSLTQRRFSAEDVELLELAGDRAASALASLMAHEDRAAAEALQRSLLPTALPTTGAAELAVRYVPGKGKVGGDWYDVFTLPSGQLCVVIGDVIGSGLAAAVIMGRMRSVPTPWRRLTRSRSLPVSTEKCSTSSPAPWQLFCMRCSTWACNGSASARLGTILQSSPHQGSRRNLPTFLPVY